MDRSDPEAERKKKVYEATTFPVPFTLEEGIISGFVNQKIERILNLPHPVVIRVIRN